MAAFLSATPEVESMNQYWYSSTSIDCIVAECAGLRVACVSTPSIFFSLDATTRERSAVLDLDEQWADERGFYRYDFKSPEDLGGAALHGFDMVVIDPPFIDRSVWQLYAKTAALLLDPGGDCRVLCTTIAENEAMLVELFEENAVAGPMKLASRVFMPSIPNLIYQYKIFTNFESEPLGLVNDELPPPSP